MTPERYEQIAQIFAQVREVIPEQRSELLRRLCGDDEELRREVESYLAAEAADVPSLLGAPVIHNAALLASAFDVQSDEISSGTSIGSYRIVRKLGEGGFGNVYLAEQLKPIRRHVALKVIKPGMDSAAVIGRFEHERQTLAILDHPNIARVIDAGTTPKGYPYFVMEYVDGEPITKFCDRNRLTLRQRLELFIPVCEAVQHAHMKGIIHRDITPNNILVAMRDGQPVPKVIDFGIAKAITPGEQAAFTISGQLIGTPEYMSPEQAMRAADIDTRTDVYSLGVVLYELLAGRLPFDLPRVKAGANDTVQHVICEADPPRPSTRLRSLAQECENRRGHTLVRGESAAHSVAKCRLIELDRLCTLLANELEWIPLRALRKDRAERYRTPAEFADDVRNYMAGHPLVAGPDTTWYRLRKFLKAHRYVSGSVVVIFASMSIAMGILALVVINKNTELTVKATTIVANTTTIAVTNDALQRANANLKASLTREQSANDHKAVLVAADLLESSNILGASATLESLQPDSRLWWEAKLLASSIDQSNTTLPRHNQTVTATAISDDGKLVASAGSDGIVYLCDARSGKVLKVLSQPNKRPAVGVVFSKEAELFAFFEDGTVHAWREGAEIRCVRVGNSDDLAVQGDVFSDGIRLAIGFRSGYVTVFNALACEEEWSSRSFSDLKSMAISPDGAIVLAGFDSSNKFVAFNGHDGTVLWNADGGHGAETLVFTSDGTELITSGWDHGVQRRRVFDGAVLPAYSLDSEAHVTMATVSSDGRWVAAGLSSGRIAVWNKDRSQPKLLHGHTSIVESVRFANDNSTLISASDDGTMRAWEIYTLKCAAVWRGHSGVIQRSQLHHITPDGSWAVTGANDGESKVWSLKSRMPGMIEPRADAVWCCDVSPDGNILLVGEGRYQDFGHAWLYDLATGMKLASIPHGSCVDAVAFAPDGSWFATFTEGGVLATWKLPACKQSFVQRGLGDSPRHALAIHPGGQIIATGSKDAEVCLWDSQSGQLIRCLESAKGHRYAWSLAFSPGGAKLAVGCTNGQIDVFDMESFELIESLDGHSKGVPAVAFSSDGEGAVLASGDEAGIVIAWAHNPSRNRYEKKFEHRLHRQFVEALCFGSDSSRIAIGSRDGLVQLIDAEAGQPVLHLGLESPAECWGLRFTPDASRLVSAGWHGPHRVWDVRPARDRSEAMLRAAATLERVRSSFATGVSHDMSAAWLKALESSEGAERSAVIALAHEDHMDGIREAASDLAWSLLTRGSVTDGDKVLRAGIQGADEDIVGLARQLVTRRGIEDYALNTLLAERLIRTAHSEPPSDHASALDVALALNSQYNNDLLIQYALAALLVRAGQYDAAKALFARNPEVAPRRADGYIGFRLVFEARISAALGHEDARRLLDSARTEGERILDPADRVELQSLIREAEKIMP